jgi:3-hydroxyisobutyrate dehydrogenase-like beta-hydroxyacid dehydrogenase
MTDITVIGLGEMGSALARAFLQKGRSVTVWNRTAAKADALIPLGAIPATHVSHAIAASPIIIVCVSDYRATRAIFDQDQGAMAVADKLIVQLSSGIPSEARALASWADAHRAHYVDGAIFAWPRQIGDDAVILASGCADALDMALAPLHLLGDVVPTGQEIGAASALFSGALAYLAGHWIGFAHGARICESEGLTAELLGETLARIAPALGEDNRHMGRVIATGRYTNPESTLQTAGNDIARLVDHAHAAGLPDAFPAFAADLFARAIAAGLGREEHIAIAKLLEPRQ